MSEARAIVTMLAELGATIARLEAELKAEKHDAELYRYMQEVASANGYDCITALIVGANKSTSLEADRREILDERDGFRQENDRLEAERKGWEKEERQHIQINAGLRLENDDLQGYANVLRGENKRLEDQCRQNEQWRDGMMKAYRALEAKIARLEAENARYRTCLDDIANKAAYMETAQAIARNALAATQPASTEERG